MVRGTPFLLAVLAVAPTLGGCASVVNLTERDGCRVYGGTQTDASLISDSWSPDMHDPRAKEIDPLARTEEGWCGVIDLPFSLVADTVLLPITVPVSVCRPAPESHKSEQTPSPEDAGVPREQLPDGAY